MMAYSAAFFDQRMTGSLRSAREIVPLVLELVQPKRVIDVGCGLGTWLSVFRQHGVLDVWGVDGDYVNPESLQIPKERFLAADLTRWAGMEGQFDLVVSLEVAEHLPPDCAQSFVDSLTGLGPVVLFSAAIPFQRGTHHVNEQWPEYWAARFEKNGYAGIDCIRKRIWTNENVDWYYAQNILLYARRDYVEQHPVLDREFANTARSQLSIVHPRKYLAEITLLMLVQDLAGLIRPEDTFILVDQEAFRKHLHGWRCVLPFLEKDGSYWGTPHDGAAAIGELERLRRTGAGFIVFARPAFWWFDCYPELERHLRERFQCLLRNERVVIFDLRREPEPPSSSL
jgi:SAM-dependent methyltransferase